jgi:hypothetical protein
MNMPNRSLKRLYNWAIRRFRDQRAPQGTIPLPIAASMPGPLQTGESTQAPAPSPTSAPADTLEVSHQVQSPTQPDPLTSNQFRIPISSIDIKREGKRSEIWESARLEDLATLDHFHATRRTAPGCFQGNDLEIRITNSSAIQQIAGKQFTITKDGKNAGNVIISPNSYNVPFQQHPRLLSAAPVSQPTWIFSPNPTSTPLSSDIFMHKVGEGGGH